LKCGIGFQSFQGNSPSSERRNGPESSQIIRPSRKHDFHHYPEFMEASILWIKEIMIHSKMSIDMLTIREIVSAAAETNICTLLTRPATSSFWIHVKDLVLMSFCFLLFTDSLWRSSQ
jgi:hypothetical protein